MIKEFIIERIEHEEAKLHEMDIDGHIWWNKFKDFIKDIPDYEISFAVRKYMEEEQKQIDLDSEV